MTPLINPLPFVFIIATAFGVVMHDTQVDQATSMAIVAPANYSDFAVADAASKSGDHVHVERVSIANQGSSSRTNIAKTQPRDDDHRYIQEKKQSLTGGGSGFWPSV